MVNHVSLQQFCILLLYILYFVAIFETPSDVSGVGSTHRGSFSVEEKCYDP